MRICIHFKLQNLGALLLSSICCLYAPLAMPASDKQTLTPALCTALQEKLNGDGVLASGAKPLLSASGTPFKKYFDECDLRNTFDGKPLPDFKGQPERCTADPNRTERLERFAGGAVFWRAKSAVDADGSPLSCGPQRGNSDLCATWLEYDSGAVRHVDAEQVPYIVVPSDMPDSAISFIKASGIGAGDLAVVIYQRRCLAAIVADSGPYFRLGEASIAVHEAFDNPQCASNRKPCPRLKADGAGIGLTSGVSYLVFPASRPANLTQGNIREKIDAGALQQIRQFLSKPAP